MCCQCLYGKMYRVSFTGLAKGEMLGRQLLVFRRLQFVPHIEQNLSPLQGL
jgi:hypothetical protein